MKRFLAIFLLLSILNANSVFGELLKFPMLIHHFLEHTQEDKDARLLEFLAQHYTTNIEHQHQNNHNGHEKLPFKAIDGNFSSIISMAPPPTVVTFVNIIENADLRIPDYPQQNYGNVYLNSIWQPPRFC